MHMQTHGYASRVQFRLACTKIPKDVLLLEIGPHALMRSPLRQNRSDLQYVATMKKGESAVDTLTAAVADLWRKGAIFNWPASSAPSAGAHPECESRARNNRLSSCLGCTASSILRPSLFVAGSHEARGCLLSKVTVNADAWNLKVSAKVH